MNSRSGFTIPMPKPGDGTKIFVNPDGSLSCSWDNLEWPWTPPLIFRPRKTRNRTATPRAMTWRTRLFTSSSMAS